MRPGPLWLDQLGLVQPDHRLSQRVAVGVADGADLGLAAHRPSWDNRKRLAAPLVRTKRLLQPQRNSKSSANVFANNESAFAALRYDHFIANFKAELKCIT